MDVQQVIALLIVAVAAAYLGRNAVLAWRAFRSGKAGCGEGCGKCAFALRDREPGSPPRAPGPTTIIPLTDLRPGTKPRRD